jgi:hypothetical protein
MLKRATIKICLQKFNISIKSAEFHTDFKSVEKLFINVKKVISKNVIEICTFSFFTHVNQTCLAYNFFWMHFLKAFSSDLKSP